MAKARQPQKGGGIISPYFFENTNLLSANQSESIQKVINIRTRLLDSFGKPEDLARNDNAQKTLPEEVLSIYGKEGIGLNLNTGRHQVFLRKSEEETGIKYIPDEARFILPKRLNKNKLKRLSHLSAYWDIWTAGDMLLGLLETPLRKPNRQKSQPEEDNIVTLPFRDIFEGYLSPDFVLDFEYSFQIINRDKVQKALFFEKPFWHRHFLHCLIQSFLEDYIFEVGRKNSSSFIYAWTTIFTVQNSPIEFQIVAKNAREFFNMLIAQKIKPILNTYMVELVGIKILNLNIISIEPYDNLKGLWKADKSRDQSISERQRNDIRRNVFTRINHSRKGNESKYSFWSGKTIEINFSTDKDIEHSIPKEIKKIMQDRHFSKSDWKRIFLLLKFWLERDLRHKAILEAAAEMKRESSKYVSIVQALPSSKVHFLHGFLLFDSWRVRQIRNYLQDFRKYVSFLKLIGDRTGIWEITKAPEPQGSQGFWVINNTFFLTNISEALSSYLAWLCSESKQEQEENLTKTCNIYPDYLDAHYFLAKIWQESKFKNVKEDDIEKHLTFLESKEFIYSSAYDNINKNSKEGTLLGKREGQNQELQKAVQEVTTEITETLANFREAIKILRDQLEVHHGRHPEQIEYEHIKKLAIEIGKTDVPEKYKIFVEFPAIKDAMRKIERKLKSFTAFSEGEIRNELYLFLYKDLLRKRKINFAKLTTLSSLQAWLVSTLYWSVKKELYRQNELAMPKKKK